MNYKNILPLDYANTWVNNLKKWMPVGEVPFEDPKLFDKLTNYGWDNSYVVVFLSEQVATDMAQKYAICYAEVLVVGLDICIEEVGILGATNDTKAEWGLNPTPLAVRIEDYSIMNQYQYLERFYVGVIEKISLLKSKCLELRTKQWYDNMTITAF
jgi:hypothetical protein